MQSRPNCPDSRYQRLCGFFIAQFLEVAQHDRFAVRLWQGEDGPTHGFDALGLSHVVQRGQLIGRVDFVKRRFASKVGSAASQEIASRPIKIGGQPSACWVEAGRVADQGGEHLLHDFVGEGRVAAHAEREAVYRRRAAAEEPAEGVGVAFGGSAMKLLVAHLFGIDARRAKSSRNFALGTIGGRAGDDSLGRVTLGRVSVRAQPGASRNRIIGKLDGTWKIAVAAPPVDGKANRALVKALASWLSVPRSEVEVVRGPSARTKVFAVSSLDDREIERRLGENQGER